jgi:hypothetical protein
MDNFFSAKSKSTFLTSMILGLLLVKIDRLY